MILPLVTSHHNVETVVTNRLATRARIFLSELNSPIAHMARKIGYDGQAKFEACAGNFGSALALR